MFDYNQCLIRGNYKNYLFIIHIKYIIIIIIHGFKIISNKKQTNQIKFPKKKKILIIVDNVLINVNQTENSKIKSHIKYYRFPIYYR